MRLTPPVTAGIWRSYSITRRSTKPDKAEGIALGPGNMLFLTDDDDFGITTGAIGAMIQKLLPPTNVPDFVEVWQFKLK